ncbi:Holliday junction resolvase RuvX [Haliea sp. E17]|uniref:Holliday junction resolvase RuvX n=1 Tax=Haliea sp. E17 TaxID=3401576 RepID=UPI003AB0F772
MSTILCFDYGLRQIGVAVGNTLLGTSTALPILRARDGVPNWEEVAALVAEWQPALLVVGEPLNMDGSDSELAQRARRFAGRLHGRLGLQVSLFDERLSSREAKSLAREQGHRGDYRRAPVDSVAAALILESWLAEQPAADN